MLGARVCDVTVYVCPLFLAVVGLDSRSKHSVDDGFVTVSLKPDRGTDSLLGLSFLRAGHGVLTFERLFLDIWVLGKRANSQENRIYLRLWTAENKSKSKNAKDLPKLNQVSPQQFSSFVSNSKTESNSRHFRSICLHLFCAYFYMSKIRSAVRK